MTELKVNSSRRLEIIDVTDKVNSLLKKADVSEGILLVFSKHTTTALVVNEAESGLLSDMDSFLEDLVPQKSYLHDRIDKNARSHLCSIVLQPSICLPVKDGRLGLGTWQRLLFVELDGPRERTVALSFAGAESI